MTDADGFQPDSSTTSRRAFLGASAAASGALAAGRWLVAGAAQGAEPSIAVTKTLPATHPLDPLTGEEIELAVLQLRKQKSLGESWRFVSVALAEPSRQPGDPLPRRAELVLMDTAKGHAFEAIVNLATG